MAKRRRLEESSQQNDICCDDATLTVLEIDCCLGLIQDFLSFRSIFRFRRVCKRWKHVSILVINRRLKRYGSVSPPLEWRLCQGPEQHLTTDTSLLVHFGTMEVVKNIPPCTNQYPCHFRIKIPHFEQTCSNKHRCKLGRRELVRVGCCGSEFYNSGGVLSSSRSFLFRRMWCKGILAIYLSKTEEQGNVEERGETEVKESKELCTSLNIPIWVVNSVPYASDDRYGPREIDPAVPLILLM
eukprot:gb/GEZN01013132.1/.p1 GENE.gb/GEZN01013132.1/~~gb/GEZN01013132.1/.p1  ORF type:complete len:241 (-),score=10.80 gb/GEZN01013132.1/:287-1009(-)